MCWLFLLTWISYDHDFLQRIPKQYLLPVSVEYFQDKNTQTEIRDSFLDLLGDVFFVVPGIVTAKHHRGESLNGTLRPVDPT